MSIELNEAIERIAANELKERHSYFQLQHFLIGKEPTIQSKLWRCVKELKARKDTIDAIKLEIDDVNDDIELINIKLEHPEPYVGSPAMKIQAIRELEIKIRKLERQKYSLEQRLENLELRLFHTEEECAFIVEAFNTLDRVEKIKPQDDFNAQKEYWDEKLGQEFNLRILLGLPPDLELIKTILALNSNSPVKQDVLGLIESIQNRIKENNKNKEFEQIIETAKKYNYPQHQELDKERDAV